MTGTGLAQVIPIAISPLLTRLYSPEDFGIFAFYSSVCTILAALATGKYEIAIVVPKGDGEAINLAAVSVALSVSTSLILLAAILALGERVGFIINHPRITDWLHYAPLTVCCMGTYYSLNYWINRKAGYKDMALSRVAQSSTAGLMQLALAVGSHGLMGLIVGQLGGQIASTLILAKSVYTKSRRILLRISGKRMLAVAKKYLKYPRYMLPGQLLSLCATELPLILITLLYGSIAGGFYSLALRITAIPLSMVANAVGDVYRQKAALEYARDKSCRRIFIMSAKRLGFLGLVTMAPIMIFGPLLFSLVFGERWRPSGEIATLLSLLVLAQTVSSPLSCTVLFPGWLRFEFLWQMMRFAFVLIIFWATQQTHSGYLAAISSYVLIASIFYLVHTYWQYRAANGQS